MFGFLSKKPQEPPHVHSFELIAKTVAEPISFHEVEEATESVFLGCTTYLWECSTCGELRKEELLGSEEPTLPNVLAKVDEQGPTRIIRNGKTYLIGPIPEEPHQPGMIPVK